MLPAQRGGSSRNDGETERTRGRNLEPQLESEMHVGREQLVIGQLKVCRPADWAAGDLKGKRHASTNTLAAGKYLVSASCCRKIVVETVAIETDSASDDDVALATPSGPSNWQQGDTIEAQSPERKFPELGAIHPHVPRANSYPGN